ncbi:hypothetical protein R1sor_003868 [Riccia sorocarpa]|uniref:ABC transporter domain-containing protein n=1 Tax=Riccia sorocarpa TaxID=122646 RepID=A0ABD3H513_9MARC
MGLSVVGLEITVCIAASALCKGKGTSLPRAFRSSEVSVAAFSKDLRKTFFESGEGSSRISRFSSFSGPRAALAFENATGIELGNGDGGNSLELGFQPRNSDNETSGAVLQVENLTLSAGDRDLISGGEWRLMPGQHTGIVGVNGCGKSTLLRAIVGALEFQSGSITLAPGTELAYLEQTAVSGSTRTVWNEVGSRMVAVKSALHELELAGKAVEVAGEKELEAAIERLGKAQDRVEALDGYRIDETISGVLNGLGFETSDWTRSCQEFSGGWQMRIALARLLLAQKCHLGRSLLILDEPTNHLDTKAKLWLAKYLKTVTAAVVLVSHEQKFLEEVCDHIVEVRGTKLHHYTGSYSKFLRTREAQQQQALQAYQAQQAEIARLQNFVDRFGAKATKASAANSKKKAIERIRGEMLEVAPTAAMGDAGGDKSRISVKLPKPPPCAREVISLKKAAVGYDNCEPLLQNVNMKLETGMRLVILGPNGCGKSTLMRAMAGISAVKDGTRHVGMGVEIGVFTQDLAQDLPGEKSGLDFVLEVAREKDVTITDGYARTALGALGLSGDAALRPIKALSGGEKARVALGVFMLRPYNCLLLDEASNHLDHVSALGLARSLSEFQGALVAISHDQKFCEALNPTHIARVDPNGSVTVSNCIFGKVEASPNGMVSQSSPTKKEVSNGTASKSEVETKNLKSGRAELKPSQPSSYQDRKRVQQLRSLIEKKLKQLEDVEGQVAAFDEEMMRAGSDVKKAMEILEKKKKVEDEAREIELQWETMEQELQQITERLST